MSGCVLIDGVAFPAAEAKVSALDRGFLYGDSAFEVMRTYGRKPFGEHEHLARLQRSCAKFQIELPVGEAQLAAEVAEAVEKSGLPECYVRVVITRGVGQLGLDMSLAGEATRLVYALPLKVPSPEVYANGITVGCVDTVRATDGTAAMGAKTSNYLAAVLALNVVKSRGAQEALFMGRSGEVVEGATSNIFCVRNGRLLTPALDDGILEGITRRVVLQLARELSIPADEGRLMLEALQAADEAFITSSIREIVPVVRVDAHVIADGRPGPVTQRLRAAFLAHTRA